MGKHSMNGDALTDRQQEILDWIKEEYLATGVPPTVREIGEHFEIKSPNGVQCHTKALIAKGLLEKDPLKSRCLIPVVPEGACKCCGRLL